MKAIGLTAFLGILIVSFGAVCCFAEEPELSLDSILEKWEKASHECKILDAKVKTWCYDSFSSQPTIEYGRLYYEAENIARIDTGRKPFSTTNDWSVIEWSFLWNGNDLLSIDSEKKSYYRVPIAKVLEAWNRPHKGIAGFFEKLLLVAFPARPQVLYPLLIDFRVEEVRKQFDLSFERYGDDILITAVPKVFTPSVTIYTKVRVFLDSKSFRAKAAQYVAASRDYRSIELYDQKINEKPSDREQLIEPDLSGFGEIDGTMISGMQRGE
jgi:hypothetical protein